MEDVLIEVPDAFAAFVLSRRLAAIGVRADVEVDGARCAVAVAVEERDLSEVLHALQSWLAEAGLGSATVRMRGHAYRLAA